jgi:hypothetical protein
MFGTPRSGGCLIPPFEAWAEVFFDLPMSVEEYKTGRELEMQNTVPSFIEMEQRSADKRRHWSSSSQTYVPADVLLEYLDDEGYTSRRKAYRRVIKTQTITFTCEECGEEVTVDLYPGGNPQYCSDCTREVRKQQNRERVRQYGERKRKRAE